MGLTEHVAVGMEGLAGKVGGGWRGDGGGGGGASVWFFNWADVAQENLYNERLRD